eukprot:CAMPEP_0201550386 /NCGR_PEP_ID=MMETSP0173_2-20130828/6758_1 /ASSEMBLY_ACC=CAM_ASM_000268 /TAXON_ID=218659 /ORGANISM="Vexillifera sp., Strain DIVA3 564/2" /LENGTH=222 /DNA_ID=CAMNT_0047960343 /DNA_START=67 /DNA_END=735 /DNA_ORIENTATION=-
MSDDQADEIEALESIYMDDIQVQDDTKDGLKSFVISVLPFQYGEDENNVGVDLVVTFPGNYPEVKALVEVKLKKGLTLSLLKALDKIIAQELENNLGMQQIFPLVETVREWLVEHNATATSIKRDKIAAAEAASSAPASNAPEKTASGQDILTQLPARHGGPCTKPQIGGTIVTPEVFNEWWAHFEKEMEKANTPVIPKIISDRPTGKQLFESDAKLFDKDA